MAKETGKEKTSKSNSKALSTVKIVVTLILIAGISGLILGLVKPLTDIDQAAVTKKNLEAIVSSCYKGKEITLDLLDKGINKEFFVESGNYVVTGIAKLNEVENAYIFMVTGMGAYKGELEMYVLIDGNVIKDIKVKNSQETPGLGSKVVDPDYYQSRYINKDISTIQSFVLVKKVKEKNQIDARTGSTKTSTGLLNCVNGAIISYKKLVASLVKKGE